VIFKTLLAGPTPAPDRTDTSAEQAP
jgi:hypothetical protein